MDSPCVYYPHFCLSAFLVNNNIAQVLRSSPYVKVRSTNGDTFDTFPSDLYDQLSTSAETRFHAAYMVLRYLLRAVDDESRLGLEQGLGHDHDSSGNKMLDDRQRNHILAEDWHIRHT